MSLGRPLTGFLVPSVIEPLLSVIELDSDAETWFGLGEGIAKPSFGCYPF